MAKFVSEKIRKKSGARLAAVQAAYMAAFSGLSVDEVVEDFLKGEIGRYAIEKTACPANIWLNWKKWISLILKKSSAASMPIRKASKNRCACT